MLKSANPTLILLFIVSVVPAGLASGQVLSDGDLDDLLVGDNPDCDLPAGGWAWPQCENLPFFCEDEPSQCSIVATSSFDPGAAGNSLHLNVDLAQGQPDDNTLLPNVFNQVLHESSFPIVIASFEIWVAEPGVAGGSVWVGGDHDPGGPGCGMHNMTDRGPQLKWNDDGTLNVFQLNIDDCWVVLELESYPVGAWQRVRLEINLVDDDYDLWWARRGDPMVQLGADLLYRASTGALDHLDRFTVARFTESGPCANWGSANSYLDNVTISVCPHDLDGDGIVGVVDFLSLLAAWGPCPLPCVEDVNEDGEVGVTDFLNMLAEWGQCQG
ncbi:MAG: hypothetical protein ACYTAQ_16435 [Planctomycetota bacterium]